MEVLPPILQRNLDEFMLSCSAQKILFAPLPLRSSILKLDLSREAICRASVNVWRNHNFESMETLIHPYLKFHGLSIDFKLSDYDDSFMFANWQRADVDVLWVDLYRLFERISTDEVIPWLEHRLKELRSWSPAPIMVATWFSDKDQIYREKFKDLIEKLPGMFFADLNEVCNAEKIQLTDERLAALTGTMLSNAAQVALAREFSCHWLAGILSAPVKAVALDLDNTLHRGALGEDGVEGVHLTSEDIELQKYIKSLQQRGVFIALVSRNEKQDIIDLFSKRVDYPLQLDDFSVIEASWGEKADALMRIAEILRIAPDAILFVDDNPGEIASVMEKVPGIHLVYAQSGFTEKAIHYYPGLWRWRRGSDDTKRTADLKANKERKGLEKTFSSAIEYFRSLQISLTYNYDDNALISRLADLCKKTNQFNMSLRRFNEAEISEYMKRDDASVVGVGLVDRLSDSGIIAVIIARRLETELIVEELCISCRALGRLLEDAIVLEALRNMPIFDRCQRVIFNVQSGHRNQPAIDWLARFLSERPCQEKKMNSLSLSQILDFKMPEGILSLIKK